jgi:hypothetical protein
MAVPEITSVRTSNDGSRIRVDWTEDTTASGLPVIGLSWVGSSGSVFVTELLSGNGTTTHEYQMASAIPAGVSGLVLGLNNETPILTGDDGAVESDVNVPVTNNVGTLAKIDRVPIATGDGVLRCNASNRASATYTSGQIPDLGADFGFVCIVSTSTNTGSRWCGARTNNSNRFSLRRGTTSSGDWFSVTSNANSTTATGVTLNTADGAVPNLGGARRGFGRVKYVSGNRVYEIAMPDGSGGIVRKTAATNLPAGLTWSAIAGYSSGFSVGGAPHTSDTLDNNEDCLGTIMFFAIPDGAGSAGQVALDDDATILRLLEDPTTLEDIPGIGTKWCPLGNVVDVNGDTIPRPTNINVATSHYLECPHNPGERAQMAVIAGTPTFLEPYAAPSTTNGPYTVNLDYGPELVAGANVLMSSALFGDTGNVLTFAWQRRSLETGIALSPVVSTDYWMVNASEDRIAGPVNPFTDNHNCKSMYLTPFRLYALDGEHHSNSGGTHFAVFQVSSISDQGQEQLVPTLGLTAGSSRTPTYNRLGMMPDGRHAILQQSFASANARRMCVTLHDTMWDDFLFRQITATGSGDANRSFSPFGRGVQPLGPDRFAVWWMTRGSPNFTSDNVHCVIGSVSGFNDDSEWFAGYEGEVLDGSGPNTLTVGSLQQDSPSTQLYRVNTDIPLAADRDAIRTNTSAFFGNEAVFAFAIVPGELDNASPPGTDYEIWIKSWIVGTDNIAAPAQSYEITSLLASVLSAADDFPRIQQHMTILKGTGRQLILLTSKGVVSNGVYSNDFWGTEIVAFATSDYRLGPESWFHIEDFSIANGGSIRPHNTTTDGSTIDGLAAIQTVVGSGGGNITLADLSAALAEIPVLGGDGGQVRLSLTIGLGL